MNKERYTSEQLNRAASDLAYDLDDPDQNGEYTKMLRQAATDAERLESLEAENARLREALEGVLPWEVGGVLEHCDGNKCREPWCAGCFGEDVAEANVERLHDAFSIARNALKSILEVRSKP